MLKRADVDALALGMVASSSKLTPFVCSDVPEVWHSVEIGNLSRLNQLKQPKFIANIYYLYLNDHALWSIDNKFCTFSSKMI